MGCLLSFLGWLFALVGCGKHCWISSALGRFVPSPLSVMWFSCRALKTKTLGGNRDCSLGESITTVPMGSLASCLSQLLERDFGDAPSPLDGTPWFPGWEWPQLCCHICTGKTALTSPKDDFSPLSYPQELQSRWAVGLVLSWLWKQQTLNYYIHIAVAALINFI